MPRIASVRAFVVLPRAARSSFALSLLALLMLCGSGCVARSAPIAARHDNAGALRQRVRLDDPSLLAGIPGEADLTIWTLTTWLDDPTHHEPLEFVLPAWLVPGAGQVKDLSRNPPTRATIELGRQLFFDPRLSATEDVSCATCHEPARGFTVGTPLATGVGGQVGRRNPPTLLNRIMLAVGDDRQMWDGSATSVEDALLHALASATEMAADPDATVEKLRGIEGYRVQFERSYGDVSWDAIGDAIGAFVRCLVTGDAPFDHEVRWRSYRDLPAFLLAEDPDLATRHMAARRATAAAPMSPAALRGERLFFGERAWCSACHNGVNFTDEQFHNIGVGLGPRDPNGSEPDLGRFLVTGRDEDWGAFKTPSIRTAVHTAPYMHDGSVATLMDVVEWYAHEGRDNRNLDYRFLRIPGGVLTTEDKQDLVAFIEACAGPLPEVETGRLPEETRPDRLRRQAAAR
jgi:cytochrome c peroxidase